MLKNCLFLILILILIAIPAGAQEKPIITVLDFTVNNVSEQDMQSIINLLSSALFQTGEYTVIDVSQRATILSEMEFSNSGCSDESCQLEIGKLLSAEMIVVGNIARVGSRFLLSSKLLETETGKTITTSDGVYGELDELIDDLFLFAERLASGKESPGLNGGNTASREEPAPEKGGLELPDPAPRREVDMKKIFAWSTMAGGVITAGVGGYLLYDAFDYYDGTVQPALQAHEEADATADFDALWDVYLDKMDQFKTKAITGGAIAGGGLLLLGVSAWLFLMPDKITDEVALFIYSDPASQSATLSFHTRL